MAGELKKCKYCQSDIAAKAKRCPQCQSDLRMWFSRHKILSGIGIIVIIGIISSAASQSGKKSEPAQASPAASATPSASPAAQAAPELTAVDITAFIAEFDANKIAAQDKYKDKYVQLTGYVSNISGGDFGGIYASIDPNKGQDMGYSVTVPYYGTNIQCYLEKSDASALVNGQTATVKGQVEDMLITSVQLKNCSVVK